MTCPLFRPFFRRGGPVPTLSAGTGSAIEDRRATGRDKKRAVRNTTCHESMIAQVASPKA
jgi:hypothetical protein